MRNLIFLHLLAFSYSCPDIITREQWGAEVPKNVVNLTIPVLYVVIHHTYQPGACNTIQECNAAVKGIQEFHRNGHGWDDIGYNFLIGGNEFVYEGRGWDIVGAHSPVYNFKSIGISIIGDYREHAPEEITLNTTQELIQCGIEHGSIQQDYKLLGHRQIRPTECPGNALFEKIKNWSHWDPLIDIIPRT